MVNPPLKPAYGENVGESVGLFPEDPSNEIGHRECPDKKQERCPFHYHSHIIIMENKGVPLNPPMGTLPTGHTSCCSTQSGLTRAISKHQQDQRHSFSDWGNFVALRAFLLAVKVCSRILDRPSVSAQNSTLLTAAQRPSCPVLIPVLFALNITRVVFFFVLPYCYW